MDFSRYILSLGSLSDNATLVYRTLCGLSEGHRKFTLMGGSLADALGWTGDAGRKRLSRAIIYLVDAGLIEKRGRTVTFVEPDAKKQEEVKHPDQVKQVKEVKPDHKQEQKPNEPVYSEEFESKYAKIVAAANGLLPAKTVTAGKAGRTIKHKVYSYISNNGYDLLKKAMVKASKCQVIQRKFGNMDLGRLVDLADNILAGLYDKDFSNNKKTGDQVEMITTRKPDQFEQRRLSNGIN